MSAPTCSVCGAPTGDSAYLCITDTDELRRNLGDVTAIVDDLDFALTRQSVFSDKLGRSNGQPLPFDLRASEAAWVLRNTLAGWARLVAEERGLDGPQSNAAAITGRSVGGWTPSPSLTAQIAAWLLGQVEWIRHHPAADEAFDEIRSAVREARRVTDRPADRWYAGPCQLCRTDLYVKAGKRDVACPECEATYDVAERREWLRAAVEDVLATTTEISRALTTLDVPITASSIRGYVHRKRLEVKAIDQGGSPLYRVGDVLDLIAGEKARRSA